MWAVGVLGVGWLVFGVIWLRDERTPARAISFDNLVRWMTDQNTEVERTPDDSPSWSELIDPGMEENKPPEPPEPAGRSIQEYRPEPPEPGVVHQTSQVGQPGAYIKQDNNGLAVAGFVLALCAWPFVWWPLVGVPTWILGIVFSGVGLSRSQKRVDRRGFGLAVAGLSICGAGLVISLLVGATLFAVVWRLLSGLSGGY